MHFDGSYRSNYFELDPSAARNIAMLTQFVPAHGVGGYYVGTLYIASDTTISFKQQLCFVNDINDEEAVTRQSQPYFDLGLPHENMFGGGADRYFKIAGMTIMNGTKNTPPVGVRHGNPHRRNQGILPGIFHSHHLSSFSRPNMSWPATAILELATSSVHMALLRPSIKSIMRVGGHIESFIIVPNDDLRGVGVFDFAHVAAWVASDVEDFWKKCGFADALSPDLKALQGQQYPRMNFRSKVLVHCEEPGCGYYAATESIELKRHVLTHEMIHTGKRPFPCSHPGCGYAATLSVHLKTHKMCTVHDQGIALVIR